MPEIVGATPEFLICLECETPCYTFEWLGSKLREAQCLVCGNEDLEQFMVEEDFDAMTSFSENDRGI